MPEAAEREAKRKADLAAYVARVVTAAPPPTRDQIDRLTMLLNPGTPKPTYRGPTDFELEQSRKAQERAEALRAAEELAQSLTACDVCNLQPVVHSYRHGAGIGFHDWVPGRAEKVMSMHAANRQRM